MLRTGANILQYASCVKVNIQLILHGYLYLIIASSNKVIIRYDKSFFRFI